MIFERLEVVIEPWRYSDTRAQCLKMRIQADGNKFSTQVTLQDNDDFRSHFERAIDVAKDKIVELVKKAEVIP